MERAPPEREDLARMLCDAMESAQMQRKSQFVLVRGNPGVGKTYTVRRMFPKAFYADCRLEQAFPNTIRQPVVILDEIDQGLRRSLPRIMKALIALSQRKSPALVILICNDLTQQTLSYLQAFNIRTIDVKDYTQEQLLAIASQMPELQDAKSQVALNIIVKRALDTGRGDCRVLFNKVKQLGGASVDVASAAKIDQIGDVNLSYGEAFCLKALYQLRELGTQRTVRSGAKNVIGADLPQIASQLHQFEFQYDEFLQVQQFIEHLETKELVQCVGGLVQLREGAESQKLRRKVEQMTA